MAEILVLSHFDRDAKYLISCLEASGHRVQHLAEDSFDFLGMDNFEIDLVLADLESDGNSPEDIMLSAAEVFGDNSPVFILTGPIEGTKDATPALTAGAYAFLPRPYDKGEVLDLVNDLDIYRYF